MISAMPSPSVRGPAQPVGKLLRDWRQRRRLSQLDLACDADISTRHLSFLETGRAQPSREMLMRLCEQLALPLRERNVLLLAAGFAPMYAERTLSDPALAQARAAMELILQGHAPNPALAVDRHWNLVSANAPCLQLLAGVQVPGQHGAPPNVMRMSLHPDALAARIANYAEWRQHVLHRLRKQVEACGDTALAALLEEISHYPAPPGQAHTPTASPLADAVVVPLRLHSPLGPLSFITTTMVFGTAVDITLSELVLETLFPADRETAAALAAMASSAPASTGKDN
jgi:transcriptional regulator with XRE-family HTH domain